VISAEFLEQYTTFSGLEIITFLQVYRRTVPGGLFQSGAENFSDNKLEQTSSTTTGQRADIKL
jgi:hypothetical protein